MAMVKRLSLKRFLILLVVHHPSKILIENCLQVLPMDIRDIREFHMLSNFNIYPKFAWLPHKEYGPTLCMLKKLIKSWWTNTTHHRKYGKIQNLETILTFQQFIKKKQIPFFFLQFSYHDVLLPHVFRAFIEY